MFYLSYMEIITYVEGPEGFVVSEHSIFPSFMSAPFPQVGLFYVFMWVITAFILFVTLLWVACVPHYVFYVFML